MTRKHYRVIAQELANLKKRLRNNPERHTEHVQVFQDNLCSMMKSDNSYFKWNTFREASLIQNADETI